MSAKKFVERSKRGPISFEEMYRLLLERQKRGLETSRTEEDWKLWGYDSNVVEDAAVRRRNADFDEWLRREHGLTWPSTYNRRLYRAAEVERRKPGKKRKPSGPLDQSST